MFFKHKKFISFLLILCTVFSMCGQALTVFAVESSGLDDENVTTIIPSDNLQDIYFELQAEDVPELIDFNEAKEKGHVQRLREKEPDNNTVIFLNEDNTETMYIFAEPIKYIDVNGEIKDKSRTLSLVENNYTMTENDVQVNFPTNVSDGISASKGEYTVSMMPVPTISETITTDTTAVLANNKVIYSDVFGTADVLYTPLYSGFKEDIILESYNGVNEFNFFVYTNGLTPIKNENGSVSFFDPDAAESVAEMMQVVCYDANNKFAGGDIVITEIKENDIYALTVIADAAFLADENTAYPVSVDPTLSFSGTTAIEDAVVYSGKPNRNYGDYRYATIGYLDDAYKVGQLLVKFPTLDQSLEVIDVTPNDIDEATLNLYTASNKSGEQKIKSYFINTDIWSESAVTWNSLGHLTPPTYMNSVAVPTGGLQAATFNITKAVEAWVNDEDIATPNKGLILANENQNNSNYARDFLCTEYVSANKIYMPCLTIRYHVVYAAHINSSFVKLNLIDNKTFQFDAYVTVDMIRDEWLSTYTFSSSDESIVSIDEYDGLATAKKKGVVTITATHFISQELNVTATVQVSNYELIVADPINTEIDNDSTELTRTLVSYVYGPETDPEVDPDVANKNVRYEIESRDYGLNVSVTNNGKVIVTVLDNEGLAHKCGKFVVKAYCTLDSDVYENIEFTVVCNGAYNKPPSPISNIVPKFGRYIRIPYANQANASNYSEFQTMCNTRYSEYNDTAQNVSEEIATNFELELGETVWHTYKERTTVTTYTNKLLELIRYSEVVCILSHGHSGSMSVNSNNSTVLTVDQIEKLHNGYFNNCKLIVLLPCSSSSTTTCDTSIADAFLAKGAKAVLGFNGAVNTEQAEMFEFTFWSCLRTDYSYAESGDQIGNMGSIWTGNHTIKEAFDKAVEIHAGLDVASQATLKGDEADINAYLTNNAEDQE